MQCERTPSPGRVRCSVDLRLDSGDLAWADVQILSLPDFATALKGRITSADALSRDATATKWAFGLVAKRTGSGEILARIRFVTCEPVRADAGAPHCTPETLEVRARVQVGN